MSQIVDEQTRILLYAAALQKLRRKQNANDRVRYLREYPEHVTEDDLDMMRECDGRTLKWLFREHPHIKQKHEDYNDSPDKIVSSLIGFTRRAWPHIRDANEFYPNWHLDLLAAEYEDIFFGVNDRLIVNQPPGTMKSYLLNVFFPAWVWAQDPTKRFAHYSYTEALPNQQKQVFLRLINSPWYTKRFGKFRILKDNEKDGLVNSRGGTRVGGGVGGALTGMHPHFLLIDDPHKAIEVDSVKEMKKALRWFAGTVATRGMLQKMAIVLCMQRLASNDLCGAILGEMSGGASEMPDAIAADIKTKDWRHACLPMRYDPEHRYRWDKDPRKLKGDLLWPERITLADIAARMRMMETDPDQANVPAQFDQDPLSKSGTLFKEIRKALIRYEDLPQKIVHGMAVRAWDRANSDSGKGDWTAGVLTVEYDGIKYILNRIKFQKADTDRDNTIERVAVADKHNWDNYRTANEVNPGPDGKPAHNALAAKLARHGIICMSQAATKNKRQRAVPFAAGVAYGEVRILDGQEWTEDFVKELTLFPAGANDDQVDAGAHSVNALNDWKAGKV
jgi:predicted phage terminase large subunit-like protein